jgi:hypothetical protein
MTTTSSRTDSLDSIVRRGLLSFTANATNAFAEMAADRGFLTLYTKTKQYEDRCYSMIWRSLTRYTHHAKYTTYSCAMKSFSSLSAVAAFSALSRRMADFSARALDLE